MKEFKLIVPQILRILIIKRNDKEIGNISYYRSTNSEINDVFDENLLNVFLDKYPQSELEIHILKTDLMKQNYEEITIRKSSVKPIVIHFIQEVGLPDQLFGNAGDVYKTKKTSFNINVATVFEEFLKDLENRYEVLIPANAENESLLDSFIPL